MIGFGHPGGLAEYVDVPEETLHELPADRSLSAAGEIWRQPNAISVGRIQPAAGRVTNSMWLSPSQSGSVETPVSFVTLIRFPPSASMM